MKEREWVFWVGKGKDDYYLALLPRDGGVVHTYGKRSTSSVSCTHCGLTERGVRRLGGQPSDWARTEAQMGLTKRSAAGRKDACRSAHFNLALCKLNDRKLVSMCSIMM